MNPKEVLLTSSKHSDSWTCCLWDYQTINNINYYKNGGNSLCEKTLNVIGNDYLIGAQKSKPIINVWPLNNQLPAKQFNWILPGLVHIIEICPFNKYLALAIETKVFIYHLSSGKLLSIIKRHHQLITSIKFSNFDNYLLITSADGVLSCFDYSKLFSDPTTIGISEPLYTKCDHSSAINDLFIGYFGLKSRFITVSNDQTCKIYQLSNGTLLCNIIFNEPLTRVIMDGPCWYFYIGTFSGSIRQYSINEPPRNTIDHHLSDENNDHNKEINNCFKGHTKQITGLDLSITNKLLVSGSDDHMVFIWDICSKQIVKRIQHFGSITNLKFLLNSVNFTKQIIQSKIVIAKLLERDLINNNFDDFNILNQQNYNNDTDNSSDDDIIKENLNNENLQLKCINKDLYVGIIEILEKKHNFPLN